ncbi:MAG: hypothetical protein KDD11_14110 [Acidobacteria bacterium]|nr:hypothetical protein [Acidobacteriota bacterium]
MTGTALLPVDNTTHPILGSELMEWLDAAGAALRTEVGEDLLDIAGVDVLDAAFNPLYLRLLARSRGDATPPTRGFTARLHRRLRRELAAARARLRSAPPAASPVVFWPREPTHLAVQIPTARAVNARGWRVAFVTSVPALFSALERADFRPVSPTAAWPRAMAAAKRQGQARAAKLHGALDLQAVAGRLPEPPISARRDELLEALVAELGAQLPEVALAAAAAEALCRVMAPAVLVVGNDLTLEGRVAARVAARHGIATASLMHGLLAREAMESRHVVDRYLAFGKRTAWLLEEMGLPESRVAVTGGLHLPPPGDLESRRTSARATVAEGWDLDPERPWILVATSGAGHGVSLDHHQGVVAAVSEAARHRPEVDWVIKLHRKDRPELYQELARRDRFANVRVISFDEGARLPILDWIAATHAVLTGGSTVALEAMTLGAPVITIDLADELVGVDFIEEGATLHATSVGELLAAVDMALEAGPQVGRVLGTASKLADETFHRPPEGADRRAAEELLNLAETHGGKP